MKRPADMPLLSGISGRVRINSGNLSGTDHPTIIVPVEAVFNPDSAQLNDARVWVIKNDDGQMHVEERKVQVGQLTANGIQITSGLADGERLSPQVPVSFAQIRLSGLGSVSGVSDEAD